MIEIVFDSFSTIEIVKGEIGSETVIYFPLQLDVGKLTDDIFGEERLGIVRKLQKGVEDVTATDRRIHDLQGDYMRLLKHLQSGKDIRVWHTASAETRCGFAYVCSLAHKYQVKVHSVYLDEQAGYARWQEVMPFDISKYAKNTKELSEEEVLAQKELWDSLQSANTDLRVCDGEEIKSVENDYYDDVIMNVLYQGPTQIIEIWTQLEMKHIIVDLSWLNQRIDQLIEDKKVKVYEEGEQDAFRQVGILVSHEF